MEKLYHLTRKENPSKEFQELLYKGLNDDAYVARGLTPVCSFDLCIEDDKGNILGGATGVSLFGSLHVDTLFLVEVIRNRGFGTKLMVEAEKIGKERGCSFATVNTMDWQALGFYQKLGYVLEFTREGFEKDSKMYMLRKAL